MFNNKYIILILVFLKLINISISDQPYQVTIWLKTDLMDNNNNNKTITKPPLCNGIIIHERLILTTATCLRNITKLNKNINNITDNLDNIDEMPLINTDDLLKKLNSTIPSIVIELNNTDDNLLNGNITSSILDNNTMNFTLLNSSDIIILAGSYNPDDKPAMLMQMDNTNNNNNNNNSSNLPNMNRKPILCNVSEIEIATMFNITTLENDLALLRLNESLPLADRRDIQWISLDDHVVYKNNTCQIGFFNLMSKNSQEFHTVKLWNNQNCTNTTEFQSPRKRDICSSYVNPKICDLTATDLTNSNDRGTGLVCDSKLIGVLSQIIPNDNNTKCLNINPFKAIYTRVSIHLNWIYEKIAIESMADLGKSNYVLATPYKESAPSPHIQMTMSPNELGSTMMPSQSITTSIPIKSSSNNGMNPIGNSNEQPDMQHQNDMKTNQTGASTQQQHQHLSNSNSSKDHNNSKSSADISSIKLISSSFVSISILLGLASITLF